MFSKKQALSLLVPGTLLVVFGLVAPLMYFLRFSLAEPSATGFAKPGLTAHSFVEFLTSGYHLEIFGRTVAVAAIASVMSLVLALPVSLYLSRCKHWKKELLLVSALFPLLVGGVVRAVGWVAIFGYSGLLNWILSSLGMDQAVDFSHNIYSVTVALGLLLVPICIIILTASLDSLDPSVERAAFDLGAKPMRVVRQVLLPQIVPGILAASSLVFVLNMNAYSTPLLVGGPSVQVLSTSMYTTMITANNWPLGAAMASIMVLSSLVVISTYSTIVRKKILVWRS